MASLNRWQGYLSGKRYWWFGLIITLLSCASFAVIATAKYFTNPRCFLIFYQSATAITPIDWNWQMVAFYLAKTPLLLFFGSGLTIWLGLVFAAYKLFHYPFKETYIIISLGLSPLLLLLFPAIFWFDIPLSGWYIHWNYHDQRGIYPFAFVKPRYIALISLFAYVVTLALLRRGTKSRGQNSPSLTNSLLGYLVIRPGVTQLKCP